MATEAEIIASNILASAIEYKRLYDTTKKNEYKVKEQRLRQIAENIKLIVAPGSTSSVSSFNGRTGAVTLTSADVTGALGYTPLATVPTLAQVTTAGNTTTNAIGTGNITVSASNIASLTLLDTLQSYSWQIRNNGTNLLFVNNGGNNLFRINANGNVLIGTNTDAGFKLDVNGTTRLNGAVTATLANVATANVVYYNSSTGLMTYGTAPVGAQFKIDYDPNITGTRNGVNLLFTTSSTFIATTTRVFLNGQRLSRGATYDYVETGTNQITFAAAPVPTDQIIIEYQI